MAMENVAREFADFRRTSNLMLQASSVIKPVEAFSLLQEPEKLSNVQKGPSPVPKVVPGMLNCAKILRH